MSRFVNPEEPGVEKKPVVRHKQRGEVANCYCPRDGHYCEQPHCENCQFERELS